jgi:hypothetical protein
MQSEQINELATALAKAQGEIENAKKNANNPFYQSKYADLAQVIDAIKEHLANNGLSYVQYTKIDGTNTILVTQLNHSSGQWLYGEYIIDPVKKDPQGMGSAMSYARRYCLSAMIGLAQEDDDGVQASETVKKNARQNNKELNIAAEDIRNSLNAETAPDDDNIRRIWADLDADQKAGLWGYFTPTERKTLKELLK